MVESLEPRRVLATQVAHWAASDLDASLASGAAVGAWTDSVGHIAATAEGSPKLVKNVLNGRSVVRFAPEDGADAFTVASASSPMSGVGDYSFSVVFATTLADPAPIYQQNFNNFTAPAANFNGGQYQSGLPVAFSGDLPGWSKSGAGVVHAVNRAPTGSPADFAAMIWQDNVITLNTAIAGSNVAGHTYRVDFQASPAVYQAAVQQTSPTDGLLIEVLRANGTVLASRTHLPGAWGGTIALSPGSFQYVGDGTGEVRIRIGPSALNSGRFGGAIDNLTVTEVNNAPPITGVNWFDHLGVIDANQAGAAADWGLSLTGDGRLATGLGTPAATRFSTASGLGNGQPHVAIATHSGGTLSLAVDGATTTLASVSTAPRAALTMAFAKLRDNRNYFRGDIADIQFFSGALTPAEIATLNASLTTTYRNDPPSANNDHYDATEDVSLVVPGNAGVLQNDFDEESGPLTAVLVQAPAHGTVELQSDGSFTYRAAANYFGADSFTYRASDGQFDSNVATVSMDVAAVIDPPQAAADTYLIGGVATTTFSAAQGVLANDFHPDGLSITAALVNNAAHGTLALNADGSFSYTPSAGFTGRDQFTYRTSDGSAQSAVTVVELNVLSTPVVISEFLASNNSTIPTRLRNSSATAFSGSMRYFDWIELRNLATTPVDLGGLHLTDSTGNLTKWKFPAGTTIAGLGQFIVFASGLDIDDPALDERGYLHTDFQLSSAGSYLALTAADGTVLHEYAPAYPDQFTDVSYGVTTNPTPGYFLAPTPGAANAATVSTSGPIITEVTSNPGAIADNTNLTVTARVRPRGAAIDAVSLVYRVMFGTEVTVPMHDDGLAGDAVAGDGKYAASISASAAAPGEMLRWKVVARDVLTKSTNEPLNLDNTGERRSPQYFGTIIDDPAINTQLDDFHWFIQTPTGADIETGTRSSVFFDGEFYDNVFSGSRGATSQSVSKKSYKFEFNVGHDFRYAADEPRVTEINVNSTFQDKAYIRPILTFDAYADAGVPAADSAVWRIEQNGQFFSVANFVEQVDEDFLEKNGLDPEGALYKMFNGVSSSTSGVEKKTREYEDNADLQALVAGVSPSNANRAAYIFDNFDIPAMINYATEGIISQDFDRWAKNFFLYRDTNGSGEWMQIPHDKDLTFGKYFFDDQITGTAYNFEASLPASRQIPHPFQGAAANACCGGGNGVPNWIIDALVSNPRTREMYLRRLRTLMDEQLQAPGTPVAEREFESQIDALAAKIAPDAALDLAKWGAIYGSVINFPTAIGQLKTNYLDERRVFLYQTHGAASQTGNSTTLIDEFANGARYFVPVNNNFGLTWTAQNFSDAAWSVGQAGLGYQNQMAGATCEMNPAGDYAALLKTCVKPQLVNSGATSLFARIPFHVDSLAGLSALTLQMKYDDAFIAYINGVEVARMNVAGAPGWNSTATNHVNTSAVVFENFTINLGSLPAGTLKAGGNVLAIHALNANSASSDMLLLPKLVTGTVGAGSVGIPGEQTGNPHIDFGAIDANPVSGIQDEEYIELINRDASAVDISGWRLTGGVSHTFEAGTVIPAGESLYVAASAKAFRARTIGPRGGQALFVQGSYQGHLSNFGEALELLAEDGSTVAATTTPVITSDVQKFLRITELMYHPADPSAAEMAGGYADGDMFEYVELHNIGGQPLPIAGTHFSNGITFEFGNVTIPAGGYVLVVSNQAAFEARYGAGLPVVGEYTGNLSNGGESVGLEDIDDGSVHDFTFDDTGEGWQSATDGAGYSLVVVNDHGPLDSWDLPASWRASFEVGGSPGTPDVLRGDFDADRDVDLADLALLQARLGTQSGATLNTGDLTGDGKVDRADVARFMRNFGRATPAPSMAPSPPASSPAAASAIVQSAPRRLRTVEPAMLVARRQRAVEATIADDLFTAIGQSAQPGAGTNTLRARRRG